MQLELPSNHQLPVKYLAAAFNNTTNSYKLYWFWSLLDILKTEEIKQGTIPMNQLVVKMLSLSWYTVNYYRLSLGTQDQITQIIQLIREETALAGDASQEDVETTILSHLSNKKIQIAIKSLKRYVPYRFMTPFFEQELRGKADAKKNKLTRELSALYFSDTNRCPIYKFGQGTIILAPAWQEYLMQNLRILEGFCLWNLVSYLQTRNPNVPNLGNKLFAPPQSRNLKLGQEFWKLVHQKDQQNPIKCIYSDQPFSLADFTIDHFIPWSFVTHDALWNLVPTSQSVNSSKSDKLPDLKQYLAAFSKLHYSGFQAIYSLDKPKLLEDYALAFKDSLESIHSLSEQQFEYKMNSRIRPLVQIASNMGYVEGWVFESRPDPI